MKTVVERQMAVLATWIEQEQRYVAEEAAGTQVLELLQNTHKAVADGTALDEAGIEALGLAVYDASMESNIDAMCGDTDSADNLEFDLLRTLWRYQPVSEVPSKLESSLLDVVMLDTQTGQQWRCEGVQFMDWDMVNDDDEWPEEDMIESGWERM